MQVFFVLFAAAVLPGQEARRVSPSIASLAVDNEETTEYMTGVRDQLMECMKPLGTGTGGLDVHLPQIKLMIQDGIFLDLHMSGCTAAATRRGERVEARENDHVRKVIANQANILLSIGVADMCNRIRTGTTWTGLDCSVVPRATGRPIRSPSDAVAALRIWASMLVCKMTEGYDELQDWGKKGMIRQAGKIAAKHAIVAVTSVLGAMQFTLAAEVIKWSSVAAFLGEEVASGGSVTFRDHGVSLIASIALRVSSLLVSGHIPLEDLVTKGTGAIVVGILTMDSFSRRTRDDVAALEQAQFQCLQHHALDEEANAITAIAKGQHPFYSGKCKDNLMTPFASSVTAADFTMPWGCVCSAVPPWQDNLCADTQESTCTSINGHTDEAQIKERCNSQTVLGVDRTHGHCKWSSVFTDQSGSCVVPFNETTMSISRNLAGIDLTNAWAACVCSHPGNGEEARCSSFQVDGAWVDQFALRRQIVYAEETANMTLLPELTNKCGQATMKFVFHTDFASCRWKITTSKLDGYKCYDTPGISIQAQRALIHNDPEEFTRL